MEALARAFGIVIRGFSATRYTISLVAGMIVLAYGGLWVAGLVPSDTELASRLGISIPLLLGLLYVLATTALILLWYFTVEQSAELRPVPEVARRIYRQTDVHGLRWFNLLLIAIILIALFLLPEVERIDHPVSVFLGIIALIPLVIDLLPFQRPRRLLVPKHGETLNDLAESLGEQMGDEIERLRTYNKGVLTDYEQRLKTALTPFTALPPGMFLEVPPNRSVAVSGQTGSRGDDAAHPG